MCNIYKNSKRQEENYETRKDQNHLGSIIIVIVVTTKVVVPPSWRLCVGHERRVEVILVEGPWCARTDGSTKRVGIVVTYRRRQRSIRASPEIESRMIVRYKPKTRRNTKWGLGEGRGVGVQLC